MQAEYCACMHVCVMYATILLAHDPLSSLAYSMISHTPPVAGNLLWLLGNGQQMYIHTSRCLLNCVHIYYMANQFVVNQLHGQPVIQWLLMLYGSTRNVSNSIGYILYDEYSVVDKL